MEHLWVLGHFDHTQAMQVQLVAMFGYDLTHLAIQGRFTSCGSTKALSQRTGEQTKSRTSDLPDPETSQGALLAKWSPSPTWH